MANIYHEKLSQVKKSPRLGGEKYGSVAEWFIAPDLKSGGGDEPSVGSNPTAVAIRLELILYSAQ